MASVTKRNDGTQPADNESDDANDARTEGTELAARPAGGAGGKGGAVVTTAAGRPAPRRPGFFTVHKRGQGYWTRMGTAIAAALLGALTAYNIYHHLPTFLNTPNTTGMSAEQAAAAVQAAQTNATRIAVVVAGLFTLAFAFFAWRAMNKPSNVDFLIATDGEMKKVNWTSRKELIGSTKVVILFMFLIAFLLFFIDIVFSYFFYLITVLKSSPFGGGGTIGGG
jgi:preprotein translocase SecE subunit